MERVVPLYTNDAECFDFRPGRFTTEERLDGGEWARVAQGLRALSDIGVELVRPSEALARGLGPNAGQTLTLESPACPTPVKKQLKYNLTRWAVTGRDDSAVNALCRRGFEGLVVEGGSDADWRELLTLWSSDFRTHVTERRWSAYRKRLDAFAARFPAPVRPEPSGAPVRPRATDVICASRRLPFGRGSTCAAGPRSTRSASPASRRSRGPCRWARSTTSPTARTGIRAMRSTNGPGSPKRPISNAASPRASNGWTTGRSWSSARSRPPPGRSSSAWSSRRRSRGSPST